jgi:hypothetical protein
MDKWSRGIVLVGYMKRIRCGWRGRRSAEQSYVQTEVRRPGRDETGRMGRTVDERVDMVGQGRRMEDEDRVRWVHRSM